MIPINKILFSCITCFACTFVVSGQSGQRFNNSLRAQYGLYQYNSKQSNFIADEKSNFLSAGLTYRHQLGRISGLNFTGRFYKWQTDNENDLNTYAAQAMYVLHPKRISSNWRINRITPYVGVGLGAENHVINNVITADTSFFNLYIPAEAGILYNLSSRWSVGIFAEYKFAAAADIKKLTNNPKGKLDIVNTGGITLAYNFGKNKKMIKAPIIVTSQNIYATQKGSIIKTNDTTHLTSEGLVTDSAFRNHNEWSKVIEGSVDTLHTDNFDTAINLFRTPAAKFLMDPKDTIDTEISNAEADLINNFSDDYLDLPDSFKTPKSIMVSKTPQQNKLQNDYKIDSLISIVSQLKSRLDNMPLPQTSVVKERTIIEKEQSNLNDAPVITQLKDSYNRLGETAERNYRQGYINENKLQEIRNETAEVKRSIANLSRENETNYNESDRIFATIALMQRQQDAMRRNASETSANTNEQRLKQEIDNLQYKLDKTLLELDEYKRTGVKPNMAQSSIDQLSKNQSHFETKLSAIEDQNRKLAAMVENMNKVPKPTKTPTPDSSKSNVAGTILFATNSAKIDNRYMIALKTLSAKFKKDPETILLLSGFADKSGSAAYNLALSKRRVQSVKNALAGFGYKKELVLERYFGSNKSTDSLQDDDRKVVIRALKQ